MSDRRHERRPRTIWLVLTVVAMIIGLGWVTTTQAQPSRPPQTTLVGRVTNADSGAPVSGVKVFIVGRKKGTSTGVDGRYALRGVPTDGGQVGFLRPCYRAVKVDLEPSSPRPGQPIRIDIGLPSDASPNGSGFAPSLGRCRALGGH
jgi:hypothetical protein